MRFALNFTHGHKKSHNKLNVIPKGNNKISLLFDLRTLYTYVWMYFIYVWACVCAWGVSVCFCVWLELSVSEPPPFPSVFFRPLRDTL